MLCTFFMHSQGVNSHLQEGMFMFKSYAFAGFTGIFGKSLTLPTPYPCSLSWNMRWQQWRLFSPSHYVEAAKTSVWISNAYLATSI